MKMTKKNLKWRLKELPTVHEIDDMVRSKIITLEEARDLLFNEGISRDDKDRVEALEKQVEFLQDLVTELSKNRTNTVVHTTEIVKRYEPYWREYRPYWMNVSGATSNSLTGTLSPGTNTSLASYTQNLLS